MAEITIDSAASGGSRVLAVGDVLIVQLPENPTTGFRWNVVQSGANVLDQQSDDYRAATPPAPGAGGQRELRFVAQHLGSAHLEFRLERSWEREAVEAFHLDVTIR